MVELLRCRTWALQQLDFKVVITKLQRLYKTNGRNGQTSNIPILHTIALMEQLLKILKHTVGGFMTRF
jgi:hypothetical protein